jgi:hypothetical protein
MRPIEQVIVNKLLHEAELAAMPGSIVICTVEALGDNKYEIKNYHISDLGVQVVVCTESAAPSHFSVCACIQAKDIPVILNHEFPVLEVPPEVPLVLRVPIELPTSDVAVLEYAPHSHHSLLLLELKKNSDYVLQSYCSHIQYI